MIDLSLTDSRTGFLDGGGEMGRLIRGVDWSQTPLGRPETWDQSLRTCIRILFTSQQPMFVWWGEELINIYNDAYRSIIGGKHPQALGQPAKIVWHEIWDKIGPRAETAMKQNVGTYDEALLLIMERYGYKEETYYTFSYSPIPNDNGDTGGIICANTSETQRIINERALSTLRGLSFLASAEKTVDAVYSRATSALESNQKDFPFTLIYKISEDGRSAIRSASAGIRADNEEILPLQFSLYQTSPCTSDMARAVQKNAMILSGAVVENNWPMGFWPESPRRIVYVPISNPGRKFPHAILVAGLNPYRKFDESYQRFTQLIADQIELEVRNVLSFEEERKRAEALAEIDKAKTTFFNNISHEFRTPLTLILGPVEEALNDASLKNNEQELNRYRLLDRNAKRLLKLVNNLLDFSRIEAGRVQAEYVSTKLDLLTIDLASIFRSTMENAGLHFSISCTLEQPVYVDREMYEKILLNLLSNAFKYTLEGSVTVELREADEYAELTVTDTGSGIPADELPHIFDRFHRVQQTRGRSFEGTGIGLSLVKELVKLHGGEIGVTSSPGKGSQFTLKFPFGKGHLPEDKIRLTEDVVLPEKNAPAERWVETEYKSPVNFQHQITSENRRSKKYILVADDNTDMCAYIFHLLSPQFEVTVVHDGRSALDAIRERKPDLLLSDIMMPGMNGMELVQELKSTNRYADLPVILLSARAGEEAKADGLRTGVDDYLVKPFSAKELLSRISGLLQSADVKSREEKNLRNILMQSPASTCMLEGPELRISLINKKAIEITGSSEEELLHQPLLTLFPELKEQGLDKILERVYHQGERFTAEEMPLILEKNGQKEGYLLNLLLEPVRNDNGKITHVMAIAIDVTVMVSARKKIETSEKKYRQLLEGSPVAVYTCDEEGRLELFNQAALELWGRIPDPAIDKWCGSLKAFRKDGSLIDITQGTLARSIREGIFIKGEEIILERPDGEQRIVMPYPQPLFDDEGKVSGGINVVVDVTEQKKSEQALTYSERRYRELIDGLPVALYTTDKDGFVQLYNKAAVSLWGNTPKIGEARWCGSLSMQTVNGDKLPLDECPMAVAIKENKAFSAEAVIVRDNEYRNVIAHPQPIRNADGEITGAINVLIDITDRKRAESAAGTREQQFRLLADAVPQHIWTADQTGSINYVNKSLTDYSGLSSTELLPEGILKLAADEYREQYRSRWEENLANGEPFILEHLLRGNDGIYRWHLSRAIPQKNDEGKIELWVGTSTDIDEIKKQEQLKNDFIKMASHELKTPVTTIKGYVQMLIKMQEKEQPGFLSGSLETIERQVAKLTKLITDLLDVSKIETGSLQTEPELFPLGQLVREVVKELQDTTETHNLEFIQEADSPVLADKDRITQVLLNLLGNAIKYSPAANRIVVRQSIQQGEAVISVQDFGIGIDASEHDKIFDRFYRVGGRNEKTYPGFGIGLFIVKEIINRHGGKLWLESEKNSGSTFYFSLPLKKTN